jgi:hypothetical protein
VQVRPDSLRRFLTRWYGPADGAGRPVPDTDGLPGPLREWFELTNGWSTPPGVFVAPSPTELVRMPLGWGGDDDSTEPTGEVLVFWELRYNGYGGSGFAVATDGPPDPTVLYGDMRDEEFNDWDDIRQPLSSFLLYALVVDILDTSSRELTRSASALTPAQHQLLVDRLLSLDDPLWGWENRQGPAEYGNRYWCDPAGDLLALTQYVGPAKERSPGILGPEFDITEYEDAYAVTLVARRPEALEPFDRLGLPWN